MVPAALRSAWAEWRAYADALDLSSDTGADSRSLLARLHRLSRAHLPGARHLQDVRGAIRDALDPWLSKDSHEEGLPRLRCCVTACLPAWQAVLARPSNGGIDWAVLERAAHTAGLACPDAALWLSPLFDSQSEYDPVAALKDREPAEALA